jgi:glycosyltransferase involved in cell wall biosynthesis
MKKLNIVQVVAYYPPHLGGMENCVQEISERLARNGNQVEVFTSDTGCKNMELESTDNIKIHYLKSIEFAHTPIIFSLFFRLLFLPKNSILHLHISQAFVPEIVYLISKIRNIPYVAHVHLDVDRSGFFGFLLKPYKSIFLKKVLQNASRIICLSINQKNLIANKYNVSLEDIDVIPNGVGEEYFVDHKVSMNKVPHLLFVGRLGSQKNIPLLINAVSLLKQDVILDIVGDGEKRLEIEKLIKEKNLKNVNLHGVKIGKELIEFYKKSDIFVITSEKEGLSLSMLEAMAAGLPMVGTDVPGIRDLIKNVGILIPNSDPHLFAKVLENLISNDNLRKKLSNKSLEIAKEYKWDKLVSKLENLYKESS